MTKTLLNNFSFYGITDIQFNVTIILIGFLLIVGIIIVLKIIFWVIRKILKRSLKLQTLKVSLPKYIFEGKELQGATPKSQQELAEKLSSGEAFFNTIASLTAQKGLRAKLLGRNDYYSFEIVLEDNLIYFYVSVPKHMVSYVMEQIVAQYEDAHIEKTEDYNIFNPHGYISAVELKLKKEYIFPIKTYKQLDSDSLNSITSSLSTLPKGSGAAIQLLVRSAHPKWHDWGKKTASKAHQGKKIKQALKESKKFQITGKGGVLKHVLGGFGSLVSTTWSLLTGDRDSTESNNPNDPNKERYTLTQKEQDVVKGIEEKSSKVGLEANLRILVSMENKEQAKLSLDNIVNNYFQFNIVEYGNSFIKAKGNNNKIINNFIHREFNEKNVFIINTEEATSLFHFPNGYIDTPNIYWLSSKKAAAPNNLPTQGLFLGFNDFRGDSKEVYIKDFDRNRHMYIIGMTGTGKSKFLDSMIIKDIEAGKGVCFIDPHGDDVEIVLENIPKERKDDVIFFDPSDVERPFGLNMLEYDFDKPEDKIFVVNQMFEIFDKLYDLKATGGPMFEQYMKNASMLIMDDPESGSTLMEISRVLADEDYRAYKLSKCRTQVVKDFWEKEAQKAGGEASLENMVPYITSKLAPFIANDLLRPIISQQKTTLDFIDAMNNNKIILVKLSKGKIGDINANLLGMIIIGKILQAAFSRADMPEEQRKNFYLYIDEFQNFLTDSINTILSEARKYKLNLIIAHQLLGQLDVKGDDSIKKTIFGNVGTKIAFRIGVDDAEFMAEEMKPVFSQFDLMNMPKYNCAVKLLIDNANPSPFSMRIPWLGDYITPDKEFAQELKKLSKLKYGKTKEEVEEEVQARRKFGEKPKPDATKGGKDDVSLEDLFS